MEEVFSEPKRFRLKACGDFSNRQGAQPVGFLLFVSLTQSGFPLDRIRGNYILPSGLYKAKELFIA
jgi:hypothetical protein